MLKFKLSKDELGSLSEDVQKEYKAVENEDGFFSLDCDGESSENIVGLKSALNKERLRANSAEKSLADVGDSSELNKTLTAKVKELEAAGAGKGSEIVTKNLQAEIEKRDKQITDLTSVANDLTAKHRADLLVRTVDGLLPDTLRKSAKADVLLHAERDLVFSDKLNDNKGGFVQADTGLEVSDWLDKKIKDSPHWLENSTSADVPGGGGENKGTKTVSRDDFYNKPEAERRQLMQGGYSIVD